MKVGYLIPEFPGQTHVWMWREICALRAWGVEIVIFSTRRPGEESKARHAFAAGAEGETVYLWPTAVPWAFLNVLWAMARHPVGFWRAVWVGLTLPLDKGRGRAVALVVPACVLARESARSGVTRLHSHTCSNSAILAMMVKRILGIPFSMTLNANIEWWGGAMREKFLDAEFTVAITRWLLDQMKRDFAELGEGQAILGRIGVDTEKWKPDGEKKGGQGRRVLTVGRLHASKGHDVLLRAVALLPGAELRIAGAGPAREELEKRVAELGMGGRVSFLGSLSEEQIISEMKGADLFVLASHAEPLGVVYMEAMSMGVATVGTAAGGVGEIIESGVNGVLVKPGDVEGLAAAISGLLGDETLRERLGRAGREKIVAEFDSRLGARVLYDRWKGV